MKVAKLGITCMYFVMWGCLNEHRNRRLRSRIPMAFRFGEVRFHGGPFVLQCTESPCICVGTPNLHNQEKFSDPSTFSRTRLAYPPNVSWSKPYPRPRCSQSTSNSRSSCPFASAHPSSTGNVGAPGRIALPQS